MMHKIYSLILAATLVSLAGCNAKHEKFPPLNDQQTKVKTDLEAQMMQAAQTAQTYHAMDNPTLLTKLDGESKKHTDYFNSLAYRELKTRNNVDSEALAKQAHDNPNINGLLPLLLLRKLDNKAYLALPAELRASILLDALKNSQYFNSWGLPNAYLQDASLATIDTGKAAQPGLRRLLEDTRPAPLYGSKEAIVSKKLGYRVCDYALYLLRKIDGENDYKLPIVATERDAAIKALPAK